MVSRQFRTSVLVLAVLVLPLRAPATEAGRHEHAGREHVSVRISTTGVEPSTLAAGPRDAIVWLNYARIPVRIRLGAGAATRTRCQEPSHFTVGPQGHLIAEHVEPLGAASLCLLAEGTYDYVVEELDTASRPIRPLPGGRRFTGRIVVSRDTESAARSRNLERLAAHHRALAGMEQDMAEARDRLADLLDGEGEAKAAASIRRRADEARAAAKRHDSEAAIIEQAMERR